MKRLKTICQHITSISLLFFWFVCLPQAWGEPVTTIRDNGDPVNRVDFVILGDGYTASELTKYANDVENAVTGFFDQEPFREYQNYFNVHRIDVISNESGADHPPDVYKDTAFDAKYSGRTIYVENYKVSGVLSNRVNPDQRDMILVIVNDTAYGGSGGYFATASTHPSVIELVLHEMGHSFGFLADEYYYGESCPPKAETSFPNVTTETNRDLIKWNVGGGPPTGWIDPTMPIPTFSSSNGIPGLYEGANYCPNGIYRPTYSSKMRSLYRPFEQINEEQLIKRIYNWVSPMDSSSPSESEVALQAEESRLFQVEILEPLTHVLNVEWYIDDQYQTNSLQFTFDANSFEQGVHTIEVVVWDSTSKVRNHMATFGTLANALTEQRTWTVSVLPSCAIDSDGDGTVDCNDNCSSDPNKTEPGICGCGVAETDTDSDGTPDCNDNCPNDPEKTIPGFCGCGISDQDSDGDGTPDCIDNCPEDFNKTEPGICGCGVAETDSDNDGTADCNDDCDNDPNKTQPGVCGCGVGDIDTDSDGTLDCNDNCPNDPNKTLPGACGCGVADTDTDSDGTPNCIDSCPNDPNKTVPGICGCAIADTDSDGDGIPDCNDDCNNLIDSDGDGTNDCDDICPNDPNKIQPGTCGCGIADNDSDGDGKFDCQDTNDDNDGLPDEEEQGPNGNNQNYDGNNDGTPDYLQDNVVSFHTYDGLNYVTMESPDGTSISNCRAEDNPSKNNAPSNVEFFYGFFGFRIEGIGGANSVTLYLPVGETIDTYYRYGPTPNNTINHWYKFLYDGQTGAEINGNKITLHFVDGRRGDDDLIANGILVDVGAPGVAVKPSDGGTTFTSDSGGGGGGCFIATAAYGSLMEPHVKILRDFRDKCLLDNALGKGFVKAYYRCSPPIADFISKHDNLRFVVRISLLPVVGISWVALKIGPASTVTLMLFVISFFIGIVWFRPRYNE